MASRAALIKKIARKAGKASWKKGGAKAPQGHFTKARQNALANARKKALKKAKGGGTASSVKNINWNKLSLNKSEALLKGKGYKIDFASSKYDLAKGTTSYEIKSAAGKVRRMTAAEIKSFLKRQYK